MPLSHSETMCNPSRALVEFSVCLRMDYTKFFHALQSEFLLTVKATQVW